MKLYTCTGLIKIHYLKINEVIQPSTMTNEELALYCSLDCDICAINVHFDNFLTLSSFILR